MLASLKRKLASWCLAHLYALPDPRAAIDMTLDARKRVRSVSVGGTALQQSEMEDWKLAAQELRKSPVRIRLVRHLKNEACRKIFEKAVTLDDLLANRMVLWTLDTQEGLLDALADMDVGTRKDKVLR